MCPNPFHRCEGLFKKINMREWTIDSVRDEKSRAIQSTNCMNPFIAHAVPRGANFNPLLLGPLFYLYHFIFLLLDGLLVRCALLLGRHLCAGVVEAGG